MLEQPLAFAGPVWAVLYAVSSALDTDWSVTLSEVDAAGDVFALAKGKLRARYRESLTSPELLTPGAVYRYTIDLWHTAIEIPAGKRAASRSRAPRFPMFSRNLNTGGHNETETEFVVAHQIVYHDRERPSHVVMPIIDF